jgi:hypothetical protein
MNGQYHEGEVTTLDSLDLGWRPLLLTTNSQTQRDDLVRTSMNASMPQAGSTPVGGE